MTYATKSTKSSPSLTVPWVFSGEMCVTDGEAGEPKGRVTVTAATTGLVRTTKALRNGGSGNGNGIEAGGNKSSTTPTATALLRRLTEAYSDRVGELGGGKPSSQGLQGTPLRVGGGGGGGWGGAQRERVRANAAALTVQNAFRKRMFHRFVWAQAYLRRPTHAFRLFKRVCRPLLGTGSGGGGRGGSPPNSSVTCVTESCSRVPVAGGGIAVPRSSIFQPRERGPEEFTTTIMSIDAWLEPPGFSASALHHVHSADMAFGAYARWSRDAAMVCSAGAGESSSPRRGCSQVIPLTGLFRHTGGEYRAPMSSRKVVFNGELSFPCF